MFDSCVMQEQIFWSSATGFRLCAKSIVGARSFSFARIAVELRRLRINLPFDAGRLAFLLTRSVTDLFDQLEGRPSGEVI